MFWWPPKYKLDTLLLFKNLSILPQNAISVLTPLFQKHKITRGQHSFGKMPHFKQRLRAKLQ